MMPFVYRMFDPMVWIVVGGAFALWRLRRHCGEGRRWRLLLAALWSVLVLISLPVTGRIGHSFLNRHYPPTTSRPADVDCVVVLGGGIHLPDDGTFTSQLDESTLRRCVRAAELYREGPRCLVILCGGIVRPNEIKVSEASVMQEMMLRLGVAADDVVLEQASRNTWENGAEARKIMEERGLKCAAVVTDALHLPRAMECFEAQGVDARGVGCHYANRARPLTVLGFVPSSSAPLEMGAVIHELVGRAVYFVRRP